LLSLSHTHTLSLSVASSISLAACECRRSCFPQSNGFNGSPLLERQDVEASAIADGGLEGVEGSVKGPGDPAPQLLDISLSAEAVQRLAQDSLLGRESQFRLRCNHRNGTAWTNQDDA
jgi:hypothetical protein